MIARACDILKKNCIDGDPSLERARAAAFHSKSAACSTWFDRLIYDARLLATHICILSPSLYQSLSCLLLLCGATDITLAPSVVGTGNDVALVITTTEALDLVNFELSLPGEEGKVLRVSEITGERTNSIQSSPIEPLPSFHPNPLWPACVGLEHSHIRSSLD